MPRACKSKRSFLWSTHTLLKSFLEFPGLYHFSRKGQFYFKASNYSIPQLARLTFKAVSLLHIYHRVTIKEDGSQPQPVTAILHQHRQVSPGFSILNLDCRICHSSYLHSSSWDLLVKGAKIQSEPSQRSVAPALCVF